MQPPADEYIAPDRRLRTGRGVPCRIPPKTYGRHGYMYFECVYIRTCVCIRICVGTYLLIITCTVFCLWVVLLGKRSDLRFAQRLLADRTLPCVSPIAIVYISPAHAPQMIQPSKSRKFMTSRICKFKLRISLNSSGQICKAVSFRLWPFGLFFLGYSTGA